MKPFAEFINEGKVFKKTADPAEARSLFEQAKERLADLQTLPFHEHNASFRFEDAYECLREALQSFLSMQGYKTYSHESLFSFAFEENLLSESQTERGDRYRGIRNDINYRGKRVTKAEAEEILSFVQTILPLLEKKLKR